MAGPLPNLHVANPTPLWYSRVIAYKNLYFIFATLDSVWGEGSSYMIGHTLSPAALNLDPFPFLAMAILFLCPGTSKSRLYLPAQPLAAGNFIFQSKPTGGRDPQCLTCRHVVPLNFGSWINTSSIRTNRHHVAWVFSLVNWLICIHVEEYFDTCPQFHHFQNAQTVIADTIA